MEEKIQHRIIKFKYAEYIGICQKKHAHDQPKKHMIKKKMTEYKKCNIVCVYCRFWRLPSCLTYMSLSWGIPWENPRRAF